MLARLGEQEKARRLKRGSGHDDDLRTNSVVLHGLVIDEVHARGLAGLWVDGDLAHNRIGAQGQISRIYGGIDQAGGRVERCVNIATALKFASAAAVTAAAVLIVLESISGDTGSILCED